MGQDCKRNSWIAAAALGALAFLVILIFGTVEFFGSIVIGVAVAIVLGFFFTMFLCPGEGTDTKADTKADPEAAGHAPTATPAASASATATAAVTPADVAPAKATPAPAETPAAPASVDTPSEPEVVEAPASKPEPAPAPKPEPAPVAAPTPAATDGAGSRPAALDAARDGKADDLKKIKGVGPKLEVMLNEMGFYHFDQIAAWSGEEVAWVDQNLKGFKGRVSRDNWVDQAAQLAAGGETEFSKRVGKGDVY